MIDVDELVHLRFIRLSGGYEPAIMSADESTITDDVADEVDEVLEEHPWLASLARVGWAAKGVVYVLMGLTAFAIGRQRYTTDDASPEGALGQFMEHSGGRAILAVVGVGLLLYTCWRLLSVVTERKTDAKAWLTRAGYLFSALFYAVLGFSALRSAIRGVRVEDSNTIERLSKAMLDNGVLRWVLFAAGVVVIGLGIFFIVKQGLQRDFMKQLSFTEAHPEERSLMGPVGTIGWIGRGVATAAVGYFVARAAVVYDADDARGFDRALREVAHHRLGGWLVTLVGVALMLYGVFCVASVRYVRLDSERGRR